ncbi:MAG TPA: sulfatase-like hydrolase/transferase [Fulvivirga sp.]|nr:sulfatase-like hydrolase/transferase [Fulvivirga sp.]
MIIPKRFSLLKAIILQFLVISTIVRLSLIIWSFNEINSTILNLIRTLVTGVFFDIGVISYFVILFVIYLLVLPNRWVGSFFDKVFCYFFYFITTLICMLSFFAEFTFWQEFKTRFNFIAVDYLIYTYEVVENINESYPIPMLLSIMFSIVLLLFFILRYLKVFSNAFDDSINLKQKLILASLLFVPVFYTAFIKNNGAEWSKNSYENELSKAGIYSIFAAFRNNELSYNDFYITQNLNQSFKILNENLKSKNDTLASSEKYDISRTIKSNGPAINPNVIFICIESLSADFLGHFGNTKNITPTLDSLLDHSIYFDHLYATGTRTVRGMEAITLSVPPSPGRSIVKRIDDKDLHNIGDVFKSRGYSRTFFYGGDGYFDNMNDFFGGNGFDIVDRGRGYLFGDSFTAKRSNIEDNEVTFENAWGVCDADIYNRVIKEADKSYASATPFFNFIMTTSNHRPFTYPDGKIDIPSGASREGAVKYTDFAIKEFLKKAQTKPWFKNTVFMIMADHCASSAGKWELNVSKYNIPALIFNLPGQPSKAIDTQCSQIDIFPTLFGYLNWSYRSYFYGKDVNAFRENDARAFIGNYRKLGLLKGDQLSVLSDQKKVSFYHWDRNTNTLLPEPVNSESYKEVVSYYQTNDFLYNNGFMKETRPLTSSLSFTK